MILNLLRTMTLSAADGSSHHFTYRRRYNIINSNFCVFMNHRINQCNDIHRVYITNQFHAMEHEHVKLTQEPKKTTHGNTSSGKYFLNLVKNMDFS